MVLGCVIEGGPGTDPTSKSIYEVEHHSLRSPVTSDCGVVVIVRYVTQRGSSAAASSADTDLIVCDLK